ncbi:glutamine hydrolyzing CTP synthase [Methanomassiliicoccus luminyensis]|uniref:glutamine hydrolyzing CTP synthase n=1 Tax=Methanomassiliicoccus luminyensis TaxID=1080712 RepID=UPI0004752080|nr:CTP synthase (glutamine hydrolyzing) [Methanomassiliicoccus luminyensis]
MKYIFVTGGVISGLGKGITASSIGRLLKSRGLRVTAIKIDPYLNIDAGTMNPFEHGEVYVLNDGGEVDLDLGNYERFLDIEVSSDHNLTTGKVYRSVIEKERIGEYLGKTVQIIPHITNEIKGHIIRVAEGTGADVCIVELGGTVGDIESMPFLEAVRQMNTDMGRGANCIYVHTTLVPMLGTVGEQKTKPTQHSVKELRAIGIQPDIIVARACEPLEYSIKRKISLFCDVPLEAVVSCPDAKSIYEVPVILEEQGLTDYILKRLSLEAQTKDLRDWREFLDRILYPANTVRVAIVGKYTHLADAYLSHLEAFHHAGAELGTRVECRFFDSEKVEQDGISKELASADAILIPGGFGSRGIEGKIITARYARENSIPYLGVCLGFQIATIEIARDVLGMAGAHSTELDPDTPYPVVDLLPEQKGVTSKGASMRLGAQKVLVAEDSKAHELYDSTEIWERHRHRFEVNPEFIPALESCGWKFTGRSEDGVKMEIGEMEGHPYFVASQFHPEFKSRPGKPSPLHLGLVKAALKHRAKCAEKTNGF